MSSKIRLAFVGRPRAVSALALAACVAVACTGDTPTAPQQAQPPARSGRGAVTAQNAIPNLNLKTTPRADRSGEIPTITGLAPLTVKLNLCTSDDADQVLDPNGRELPNGDSLNWQFSFGEPNRYEIGPTGVPSPDPAFDPSTGRFVADFDHFCRTEHVYEEVGTFIATVSVTDKHLEDQSAGALARRTERLRIVVLGEPIAGCAAAPSVSFVPNDDDCSGTHATAPFFTGEGLTFALAECGSVASRPVSAGSLIANSIAIDPSTGVITFEVVSGSICKRVVATNACGSATSNEVYFCD